MAYTEDEIRARILTLENGLVQVAKGVTFADRGITYNSAAEILERIGYFRGLLLDLGTTPVRSRQSRLVGSKGL